MAHLPLVGGDLADGPQGEDADEVAVVTADGESGVVVAEEVLVDRLPQRSGGGDGAGIGRHQVPGRHPSQDLADGDLGTRGSRRLEEEPADGGIPQAAEVAAEEDEQAEGDEAGGEEAADVGCSPGRLRHVAARSPQYRPQHPAPVEGEPGKEVEHPEGEVDPSQVAETEKDGPRQPPGGEVDDEPEHPGDGDAGERPDHGDGELVARPLGILFGLGHPPEYEKGYPLHRHASAPGHDGVADLVEDDRGEEERRRDCRQHQGDAAIEVGKLDLVETVERPPDEQGDDGPGPVDGDVDAEPAAYLDSATQHAHLPAGRPCPPFKSLARMAAIGAAAVPRAKANRARSAVTGSGLGSTGIHRVGSLVAAQPTRAATASRRYRWPPAREREATAASSAREGGAHASNSPAQPSGEAIACDQPTMLAAEAPATRRRPVPRERFRHHQPAPATRAARATSGRGDRVGIHHSDPCTVTGVESTLTGTVHSVIKPGRDRSIPGGGWGAIQCTRWSCHPTRPLVPIRSHLGAAAASACGGTVVRPKRSSLIQKLGEAWFTNTVPSGSTRK